MNKPSGILQQQGGCGIQRCSCPHVVCMQYKARSYIMLKSMKSCKREIKTLMSSMGMVSDSCTDPFGLFPLRNDYKLSHWCSAQRLVHLDCFFTEYSTRVHQEQLRVSARELPKGHKIVEQCPSGFENSGGNRRKHSHHVLQQRRSHSLLHEEAQSGRILLSKSPW